jgi:hypothetical protein
VNAADAEKRTPLHWAAGMGHADVAALLLKEGASLEAADSKGNTPLMYAGVCPLTWGRCSSRRWGRGSWSSGGGNMGQQREDCAGLL